MLLTLGAVGTWFFLNTGFNKLQQLRQLERVPESKAGTVLLGEVNISAPAKAAFGTLSSPHTNTSCLYYLYTHEVETRDSDGNTSWRTQTRTEKSVDFLLYDETGEIPVITNLQTRKINWSVRRSFRVVQGKNRYTEYRIEPNDIVYAFGKAERGKEGIQLVFAGEGFYTPIVSNKSQAENQESMGAVSLYLLWGGLCCVAIAVLGLVFLLGVHRLMTFLSILTFCLVLVLLHLSLKMMKQDIANGVTRYDLQREAADLQAREVYAKYNLPWPGWDAISLNQLSFADFSFQDQTKIREYGIGLALSRQQLVGQMNAIPERWLIGVWGYDAPLSSNVLSDGDQAEVDFRAKQFPETRLTSTLASVLCGFGGVVFFVGTFLGYRQIKFKRMIENIPSSKTIAASCGLAEVCGDVSLNSAGAALTSPLSRSQCVWYYYKKEERRGVGKNAKWVIIDEETQWDKFSCKDDEGKIAINARDAEIITQHHQSKREGKYRYTERLLRSDDPLYAIGAVSVNKHRSDTLVLGASEYFDPFILSNLPERTVMIMKAYTGMSVFVSAFCGLLLALLLFFGMSGGFSAVDFMLAATAAPIYLLLMTLVIHYNDLLFLRNRVTRNWSNIDVSLKKRANLIENIHRIVTRYMSHEQELLMQASSLRASLTEARAGANHVGDYLDGEHRIHKQLSAVLESYPELKSNTLVRRLMASMTRLENEVSYVRKGYNDAVELYNTRIASFPDVLFAKIFGFKRKSFIAG